MKIKYYIKRLYITVKYLIKNNPFLYNCYKEIREFHYYKFSYILNIFNKFFIKQKNLPLYKQFSHLSQDISQSETISYYQKSKFAVGIITDEYMFNYYNDAISLYYLSPDNYTSIIDNNELDLILFISCWDGIGNTHDWKGEKNRLKVIDIFNYAKSKNIKTVFQTIEDPSNFLIFLEIAKHADYIFTSAEEKIGDYKKETQNENVFLLTYGINPIIHNPIGLFNNHVSNNDIFFAGSWASRYKERCQDMSMIFDGVIKSKHNLVIADRNSNNRGYSFPHKYYKYTVPAIEHKFLQNVHKLFLWNININSIKYSISMCAMRVYELQALGRLILSNYALSVSNLFPYVFSIIDQNEIKYILSNYTDNEKINMQLESIRNMFSHFTVQDKLNYIFECINVDLYFENKTVYVIYDDITDLLIESFDKQTYRKKILLFYNDFIKKEINNAFCIFFSENTNYDKYFIEDLVNGYKYTDANYIRYEKEIKSSFVFEQGKATKFDTLYNLEKVSKDEIIHHYRNIDNGFSVLSKQNHQRNLSSNKELGVIIPVYNNGKYLKYRCFRSLLRSSNFNKMQLYIIDDGSDQETIDIINELQNEYENITTYFFKDNGSGSASRPRNKGVELCKEKLVTFLDPDNEAINDGYAKLLYSLKENDVDFSFGSIYKISEQASTISFSRQEYLINDPKNELISKNFKTNSIQACVIKTQLITDNNIQSPVGALGQDSLFFYELMLNATSVYHLALPIHIYYAQRKSSVVNTIDISFFEKFYILEQYQVKKLKQYGVFEEYKKKKFHQFFNDWYLEKMKYIYNSNKEDKIKLKTIINKISSLYL